ncbi:DNA-binding protein [Marinihelvus fidelis]|uniref:DNA-binding protein n=1 Tax=Marinihelvus fidelis TaxID=2613842 RepID=A0A5N0TE12_9GAMM|nr:DNA-binding protein [Marinihelvus fidelis]KAA9131539.1 DNA-binding protein [Marinihelvus fidelis]
MNVYPIKTEHDYERALARVDALMDARPDTPQGDELDILVTLIEAWEERQYPIASPDPVAFLKSAMDLMGKDQAALATLLKSRPRASELLNRQRCLSLAQIRAITSGWNLPAEPLIQAYETAT